MFGVLKKQKPAEKDARNAYGAAAESLYAAILTQVRQPAFYRACGVPDTLDGRFDLMVLHAFFVMETLCDDPPGAALNQALFDVMFQDMDQMLRERGIGDMGIPKHMRRMMQGFNGRMAAYQDAAQDKEAFKEALQRNVYNGKEAEGLQVLLGYADACRKAMNKTQLLAGQVVFPPPEEVI